MNLFLRHPHYVLILFLILVSVSVNADVWESPGVKTYYSENKEYKIVITSKITPDKYYLWNYYKSERYPQTKKFLRKREKFMHDISGQDTILIPCTAKLYQIDKADSVLIWERTLLNDICPVHVIIANDGSSVATFDNWYSVGYGVNVFVISMKQEMQKRLTNLKRLAPSR